MTVPCRLQALLGMLGKLKRTLTQNLSEQKRITDDKGTLLMIVQLPLPLCRAQLHYAWQPPLRQVPATQLIYILQVTLQQLTSGAV